MEHACPRCGKPTEGAWSEGGLKWAICDDCMEQIRRESREELAYDKTRLEVINDGSA